jgi:hypothetical protein
MAEIPQWMFDSAVCGAMSLSETPRVGWDDLRRLRELLAALAVNEHDEVVKHRHPSSKQKGDADAGSSNPSRRSIGTLPSSSRKTSVADAAEGRSAEDREAAGPSVAGPSYRAPRRRRRKGGVR